MPANKPLPRLVPTLTEVVQPGLSQVPSPTTVDATQLAEQVLKLVKPRLEQQLRISLQAVIEHHLRDAAPRIRRELEEAVKVAVEQSINSASQTKH